MNKILGLGVLLGSVAALSACGSIPECNQYLDECDRGGPYTEERTAQADKRVIVAAPEPVVEAPAPVVVQQPPPPAPEPVVVDDTPVMTTAEPQFTQISK
jgi:hypothetical protein